MSNELVQVPYEAIRGQQLTDGGWKYQIWTPELLPEHIVALSSIGQKPGWFVVKANAQLAQEDVPDEDAPVEQETKTPTQRLYNVLYVYWQQQGAKGDFETYRRRYMEAVINKVKEKLQ